MCLKSAANNETKTVYNKGREFWFRDPSKTVCSLSALLTYLRKYSVN